MKFRKLSAKELHEKFIYFPETGYIINKETKEILGSVDKENYIKISFNDQSYPAHRIAYCMFYGELPDFPIDHINHITTDNRICNIRLASFSGNNKNSSLDRRNTSGIKGVTWNKYDQNWKVMISYLGKSIYVGGFKFFINAVKARYWAEQKFQYNIWDKNSTAKKYLENVERISFSTNIKIEKQKESKKSRNTVSGEWEFFCLYKKPKLEKRL